MRGSRDMILNSCSTPKEKERKMKREKTMRTAALTLTLCLTAVSAAGCGKKTELPIIGETSIAPGDSAQSDALDGSGNSGDSAPSGDAGNPAGSQTSLEEMLALPERYTNTIEMDGLQLTADAQIQVPDVETIRIKTVKNANFSQETYETVRAALGKEYQVNWVPSMAQTNIEGIIEQSEGGEILLTYHPSADEDGTGLTSLIWAVSTPEAPAYQEEPDGEWETVNHYGKSDPQTADRLEQAETLEMKAKELVNACGLTNYQLRSSNWTQSKFSGGGSHWTYSMRLTPAEDGIGLVPMQSKLGEADIDGPYLKIVYTASGILSSFQLAETYETVEEPGEKEELFLLPFPTIAELFEQYVRDTEENRPEAWTAYWADSFPAQSVKDSADGLVFESGLSAEKRYLRITRVALEYGMIAADGEETSSEKQLVPVWSFYGCKGDDSVEEIILSVRADDGRPLEH